MNLEISTDQLKRETIIGSRRFENYFWSIALCIGGSGFILASLSSYFNKQLLPFNALTEINFVPQGLVMLFYGLLGISFSVYITLTIFWDVGGGYNEYDKTNETIRLVRRGFPGKDRNILLNYSFNEIKSIEVEISEGINPKRTIYLTTNDKRRIPLTGVGEPLPLTEIEEKAIDLAKFLNLPYNISK
uniref:Photosystem I assembly protein Ycf4 n=1 Tax=Aureoumbra lagunensis TaxID=44058 RepID=C6KJ38_9STRA|nr:photosystem I assembly protein Ycf4 [Aureoumbra lagunensis]ACS36994.1 photosystem I assembly protein Ycf4 [Aureoumbra lagunensis]